jgi:hypothetical protein
MSFINTLAIAMGSSWVSGINLYAAVATLGLLGRFAGLKLPGDLGVLTSWWIIGAALFLYAIEFFADKIPVIDSTWDAVHTFIRIPAGAVLAASAFGDFDKGAQVIAFLVGGGLAFSSHGTKASARVAINASPEPASNIAASVVEDFVAVGAVVLAWAHPALVIALVLAGVIVSILIMTRIARYIRTLRANVREVCGF